MVGERQWGGRGGSLDDMLIKAYDETVGLLEAEQGSLRLFILVAG
jgi:hypothetical protein